jgi:hypothetical protein
VGTSGFRAYLLRRSRYVLIPNVIAITGTKESEANNMRSLVRKFNGEKYNWAWSFKKKVQAETWAEIMRNSGIKVRIITEKSKLPYITYICDADILRFDRTKGTHSWKILKGKAYAAAERA